jgi:hypothetical protein
MEFATEGRTARGDKLDKSRSRGRSIETASFLAVIA